MSAASLACFDRVLSHGLRFVIYEAEEEPETPEPGPVRIRVFKFPNRPNEMVLIASGANIDKAVDDLNSAPDELLAKVGTIVP